MADELMRHWIGVQAKVNPAALDTENYPFTADVRDRRFLEAASAAERVTGKDPSLEEVVRSLPGRGGWGVTDERVLSAATEDDYYRLFKSLSGKETGPCVRACLKFGEFANSSDEYKAIAEKARAALQRIGSENRLNRRRVRSLGIEVPELGDKGLSGALPEPDALGL